MQDLVIGIVIVSYGHGEDILELVKKLKKQTSSNDEIVIIDNHPGKDTYNIFKKSDIANCYTSENLGFGHACNLGVKKLNNKPDTLLFINPDASPRDDLLSAIRNVDFEKYAAVMPTIILPDGRVNTSGNVLHTSGLSWCGNLYGKPIDKPVMQETYSLSGACFAISKDWWKKLGGMDSSYFMYYEDTDLSTRISLLGGKQAVLNNVYVEHDYDFTKGKHKWLYIERNHPLYMIKTWPLSVLILLSLQNLILFVGLWFISIVQGRLLVKMKATIISIKALPSFLRARRSTQKSRVISSAEFINLLDPTINNKALSGVFNSKATNTFFIVNYKLSKVILNIFSN
ncbi:glycosyltransferase family 2 protein [Candidatus Saccharibacteria bacterium]|nr:glycosyltransferase family 2 protein [Candidatus Saccharibacteria bacterium]